MKVIKVLLIVLGITLIVVVLSIRSFPQWLTIPGGLLFVLGLAFNAVLDAGGKIKDWIELLEKKDTTSKGNESEPNQDIVLQDYFDRMNELILEKNLQKEAKGSQLSIMASVTTKTALSRLNGYRKGLILKFLYESNLVGKPAQERPAHSINSMNSEIVSLEGANLSGVVLQDTRLCEAVLVGANLDGADFTKSNLSVRQKVFVLGEAGLSGRGAFLIGSSLRKACLKEAILTNVVLDGAILIDADLRKANLQGAYIRTRGGRIANFEGANLEGADLTNANLLGAINFDKANTSKAILTGAVMPDGKIHI